MESQQKEIIRYPENLKVFAALKHWEKAELARRTGYGQPQICHLAKGRRRMNDKVKRAIIEIKKEAQQLNQALEQAIQGE